MITHYMTEKQLQIVETALHLFAEMGFDAVSTNKIAQEAGVSEGLIFRHFQNKLGLLNAIMQIGAEKIALFSEQIEILATPEEKIQAVLELPFHIKEDEYPFWKLLNGLKWQNQYYDQTAVAPIRNIIEKAFKDMNYSNPTTETDLILAYTDGLATSILLKSTEVDKNELLKTLRKNTIGS